MLNTLTRKWAFRGCGVLLLLCIEVLPSAAQLQKPDQHTVVPTLFSSQYVKKLRPDTTADHWLESHIAVSSRHYIGAEFGTTRAWMAGERNFYFPLASSGATTNLPFNSLGSGEGFQFGGVVDFSLSDIWGLQGKLRYFNTITQSSEPGGTVVAMGSDGIAHSYDMINDYSNSHTFLGADALVRYQLVAQHYYALGGAGVAWPISESFSASRHATDPNAILPAIRTSSAPADTYFNSVRADLKIGFGTFLPVTEDMVVTPELMLSIPMTPYFTRSYESAYHSSGVGTPRQWYVTASVSVKFPNGGFSLYAIERDRQRRYEEQYRRASVLHPIPLMRRFDALEGPRFIRTVTLQPDTLPDYEVDSVNRLVRFEDIGPNAARKLRLVVFFDFGKAELAEYSFPDLDRLARVMLKHHELTVEIAAYTDSRGSIARNIELSQQRAIAVQKYLMHKGVDELRLPAHGYGPGFPVATNETPEGRASNRRVEFVVTNGESASASPQVSSGE